DAGIWRFQPANSSWFNLTNVTSANRANVVSANTNDAIYGPTGTLAGLPYSPGPDDDYRISFPNFTTSPSLGIPVGTNPNGASQFGAVIGGFGIPVNQTNATWTGVQTLVSFNPVNLASNT